VAFNVRRPDGGFVGYTQVDRLASAAGVHLRTGCCCNPGGCNAATGGAAGRPRALHNLGKVCGDGMDVDDAGMPTGVVRVSFGYSSTWQDADRLVAVIEEHFVDSPTKRALRQHQRELSEVTEGNDTLRAQTNAGEMPGKVEAGRHAMSNQSEATAARCVYSGRHAMSNQSEETAAGCVYSGRHATSKQLEETAAGYLCDKESEGRTRAREGTGTGVGANIAAATSACLLNVYPPNFSSTAAAAACDCLPIEYPPTFAAATAATATATATAATGREREDDTCPRRQHSAVAVISSLSVYPLKSAGAFQPPTGTWPLGPNGLLFDREWALVSPTGAVLQQRQVPALSALVPEIDLVAGVMRVTMRANPRAPREVDRGGGMGEGESAGLAFGGLRTGGDRKGSGGEGVGEREREALGPLELPLWEDSESGYGDEKQRPRCQLSSDSDTMAGYVDSGHKPGDSSRGSRGVGTNHGAASERLRVRLCGEEATVVRVTRGAAATSAAAASAAAADAWFSKANPKP